MSSLLNLLLPRLCPRPFRPAAAFGEDSPTFAQEQVAPVAAATNEDAARSMRARQLKNLYHRTLRNQGHGDALTHSGLLSA
jgi:hypothetical protein